MDTPLPGVETRVTVNSLEDPGSGEAWPLHAALENHPVYQGSHSIQTRLGFATAEIRRLSLAILSEDVAPASGLVQAYWSPSSLPHSILSCSRLRRVGPGSQAA